MHEATKVAMQAIGIKCSTPHHIILWELFSQLSTNPLSDIAHTQFSLSSILMVIGQAEYQNLIRDNNKYFNNLVTIPVAGITNAHLDLDIEILDPKDPHQWLAIQDILLDMKWCTSIKTTQTDGQLLLITNKMHFTEAHKWLDINLEHIFTQHLPKKQNFITCPNHLIPCCFD